LELEQFYRFGSFQSLVSRTKKMQTLHNFPVPLNQI
jgi:hypothetical protein